MSTLPNPNTVTRLYRLVLRHAGAAVLYSHPATPNLRALYRPEFDIWMKRAKLGSETVQRDRADWESFADRLQNTLELFHQSSQHADLTHRLVKNLASMQYHMDAHDKIAYRKPGKPSAGLEHSRLGFLRDKKITQASEAEKLQAWDGFAELVGMAEGSAGLLLGKVRPHRPLEQ